MTLRKIISTFLILLRKHYRPAPFFQGLLMLVLVSYLDLITGVELAASIFYLLPIIFWGWYLGPAYSAIAVMASTALWLAADVLGGHEHSHPLIIVWNTFVRFVIFSTIAVILGKLRRELQRQTEYNTQLLKANEEILKLAGIKSEFCSIVSHELRTPLTAIKESLGIVSDGWAGDLSNEQRDFLMTAARNVDRLGRLIDDVLDFQKLESGAATLDLQPENVNVLVREMEESFGPLAGNKGLRLVSALDSSVPAVLLDRDKITQVLSNLINNAMRFSSRGTITLQTKREARGVRISIEDEGPGIREEDLPKLFQSFSQLGTGMGRRGGGSGLGLAISKKIIEEHHGTIGVESQYGKGSVFYFFLPEAKP